MPEIVEGVTARRFMAEQARANGMGLTADGSPLTDMEITSSIQYFVFPNLFPWQGPIFYRFRPLGHDPDKSIMECWLMVTLPPGTPRPEGAKVHWLREEDDWTEATELGMLGEIFNQDSGNIPFLQKGLKAAGRSGITLANYGDIRIRQYHKLLDEYLQG
jgi:hypothetical protein